MSRQLNKKPRSTNRQKESIDQSIADAQGKKNEDGDKIKLDSIVNNSNSIESEDGFKSCSQIDSMTENRQIRIKKMLDESIKQKVKEKTFKGNNKEWPPSQHYIYINHKLVEAKADDITQDWAERSIFNSIIQNIMKSDSDYINSIWCQHSKAKITEDFEGQIQQMYKASEGNCDPSEDELKAFIEFLKASSDPKDKMLANKGVDSREIFNLARDKNYNMKKIEKLTKLKNTEMMMKSNVMPPYFNVDVDKTFYEEVKEEIFTKLLPNQYFPDISQLKVHQQTPNALCGFHCYYNAQCMVKALISNKTNERIKNLSDMNNSVKFWACYLNTVKLIQSASNPYYVNKTDKLNLVRKQNPLERSMLKYLLLFDPDILALKNNSKNIKVFMRPLYFGFGLMQTSQEQIKELNDELEEFHESKSDSIFVLFIGALNHWVNLVVHKTVKTQTIEVPIEYTEEEKLMKKRRGSETQGLEKKTVHKQDLKFYLLDSMNFEILDYSDKEIPQFMNQKVKERLLAGLSPMNNFTLKMTIQAYFDLKRILTVLQDVFYNQVPLNHYYAQCHIHNKLKFFFNATEELVNYYEDNYTFIKRKFQESKEFLIERLEKENALVMESLEKGKEEKEEMVVMMMNVDETGDLKSIQEKEDNSDQIKSEQNQQSLNLLELQVRKNQSLLDKLSAETDDSDDDNQGMKKGSMNKMRVLRFNMPKDRMAQRDVWQKFEEKQEHQRQIDLIGPINALKFKPGAAKRLNEGYTSIRRNVIKKAGDNMSKPGFGLNSNQNKNFGKNKTSDEDVERNEKEKQIEEELKLMKITPGRSFVSHDWDIEVDFLSSYKVMNAKIPSFELLTDEKIEEKRLKGKKRPCYYKYLEMMTEGHYQKLSYKLIVDYLKSGVRVADIEWNTLRNIQAFGAKDAFFEEDRILLMDWCQGILFTKNQFDQRSKQTKTIAKAEGDSSWNDENLNVAGVPHFSHFEEIEPLHHVRFQELAELCQKILRKLDLGSGAYRDFNERIEALNEQFEIAEKQRIMHVAEVKKAKEEQELRDKVEKAVRRKQELAEKQAKRKQELSQKRKK